MIRASPKWLQRSVNRSLANRFSLCRSTILSSPCRRDRLRCYARRIGAHPHARPLAPWWHPGGGESLCRVFLSRQRKQSLRVGLAWRELSRLESSEVVPRQAQLISRTTELLLYSQWRMRCEGERGRGYYDFYREIYFSTAIKSVSWEKFEQ